MLHNNHTDADENCTFLPLVKLPENNNGSLTATSTSTPVIKGHQVTLNISGLRYQTSIDTLEKYPNSLLGSARKRQKYYDPDNNEYFFDRHRPSFDSILYFYQSDGYLKRPGHVPLALFERELQFFDLGPKVMQKFWESEGAEMAVEVILPTNPLQRKIWQLIELPDSSRAAKCVALLSIFVIVLSTTSFCLETIPELRNLTQCSGNTTDPQQSSIRFGCDIFSIIETGCILWFTIEFLLRFICCPSKLDFIRTFLNWVDIIAIVPFYVNLVLLQGGNAASLAVLRVFRLVRVFRVFKLSRHSRGLQILGKTLVASLPELYLLIFFLLLLLVLSASAIYFAEYTDNSQFSSIPASFWYAIVTLTTVGYGDMYPKSPYGKVIGSVCAIVGVLVIALPATVIVSKFKK